jgi:hypothetical protein
MLLSPVIWSLIIGQQPSISDTRNRTEDEMAKWVMVNNLFAEDAREGGTGLYMEGDVFRRSYDLTMADFLL